MNWREGWGEHNPVRGFSGRRILKLWIHIREGEGMRMYMDVCVGITSIEKERKGRTALVGQIYLF